MEDDLQISMNFKKCIVEEWEKLSKEIIKKLYKSLPQRYKTNKDMAAFIKCKGGYVRVLNNYKTRLFLSFLSIYCFSQNSLSF